MIESLVFFKVNRGSLRNGKPITVERQLSFE